MEFKDKLKQLRLSKNLSQEAIAKDLVTSRSTYAKWETGIRLPNSASLELIAKYFNITVEELFDNEDKTNLIIKNNDRLNDLTIGLITITSLIVTCFISILYFFKIYGTYCIDILGLLDDKGYIYITYSLSEMEGNPFWIISLIVNVLFITSAVLMYVFRNNKHYKIIKIAFIVLLILALICAVLAFLSGRFMLANWLEDYLLVEV